MTKLEQAARQALETLIEANVVSERYQNAEKREQAITALREALDNSLKPKCFADYQPNHAIERACEYCAVTAVCQTGEQAEQKPIGYVIEDNDYEGSKIWAEPINGCCLPVYLAPVRTKDLTDDEIMKINVDTAGIVPTCDRQFHFARAVIAADREKNK